MKSTVFATLVALTATPLAAQTAPAPVTMPAASAKFTVDTPIETLMADTKARAVVVADLGGDISQHPMYDSFKSMSLSQVAPMSGGKVTDEVLKKVAVDLAAVK